MSNIFCFGASNAFGKCSVNGGWPDRLKQYLSEEYYGKEAPGARPYLVYNLCISGEPMEYLKQRVVQEIQFRQRPGRDNIVIFEVGGNDAIAKDTPDGFVSTPEAFRASLEELLDLVRPLANQVMFIGMPPHDESKTMPAVHHATGQKLYMSNERRRLFEGIVADFCKVHNVPFAPFITSSLESDWTQKHLWRDGQHMNEAGHAWLFDQRVKPAVLQLLENVK